MIHNKTDIVPVKHMHRPVNTVIIKDILKTIYDKLERMVDTKIVNFKEMKDLLKSIDETEGWLNKEYNKGE